VLREQKEMGDRTTSRLVGQAYLEGAMDGEKVESSSNSNVGEIILV